MKGAAFVVVGIWVAACATGPRPAGPQSPPPKGPETERALPIPADLAPHIQESIEVGRMLYFLDKASAIGTDVLRARVPDHRSRGIGGWLTFRDADESGKPLDAFGVLFYSREERPRLLFRIDVPLQGQPRFAEVTPPKELEDLGLRMSRARQTAIAAVPKGPRPFNPVILPGHAADGPDAIIVYLLAAEQRVGEMVFGIHYRIVVSGDGTTAKEVLPLSKSELVIGPEPRPDVPKGAVPVASMVSQIVTDWPLETHVFVSLLHNREPIYVVTQRGVWLVIGDKVILVDDKPPRSRAP